MMSMELGDEVCALRARIAELEDTIARQAAFSERAPMLLQVIDTLARARTFDEMCICAVEIGRTRLKFDRVGIWFRSEEDPNVLVGSYGTDEHGALRDERHRRVRMVQNDFSKIWHAVSDEKYDPTQPPIRFIPDADLVNDVEEIVGKGDIGFALLCDGEKFIGYISFDNLLSKRPITQGDLDVLGLLSVPFSHFCTRWHTLHALEQSEERYRSIFENSELAIFQVGPDLVPITANSACATMIGYASPEELMRNRLRHGLHVIPDPLLTEIVQNVNKTQGVYHFECEMKRIDGRTFLASVHVRVIRDSTGNITHYEGFMEDIGERKRFEAHVRETQKLESLGVLAGGIAHDFNNLLMGVLGNADLIMLQIPPDTACKRQLDNLITAAHRAADLSRLMLAYSGKGRFEIKQVNLTELVEEMLQLLQASISKKAVIQRELMPVDQHPVTAGDAAQLRQVVMNLITNASDALEDNDGVITVRTHVEDCGAHFFDDTYLGEALPAGRYVVLEVADNGSGIDTRVCSRIFDPFFTTKFIGRGLGLSAVLGIVRAHHGAIQIDSHVGKGTTFRVFLPLASTPVTLEEAVSDRALPSVAGHGVILVVDDEAIVLDVAKRMLEYLGFTVLTARDGIEALQVEKQHHGAIQAVVLDLAMPHMNGEEVYQRLRDIDPELFIVISSGYAEIEITERFQTAIDRQERVAFIPKPYELASLSQVLAAARLS